MAELRVTSSDAYTELESAGGQVNVTTVVAYIEIMEEAPPEKEARVTAADAYVELRSVGGQLDATAVGAYVELREEAALRVTTAAAYAELIAQPPALATVRRPTGIVEVKWDGVNWTDETDRLRAHSGEMGISAPGDQLVPPGSVGQATVELWNADGRYSWKRADSPLAPYIGGPAGLHGKEVRISMGLEGWPMTVIFTGVIFDWIEDPAGRTITLELRDMGYRYLQHKASTLVYQDLRADEWIAMLAGLAGIPAEQRSIDVSAFTIPFAWLDDEGILAEMWAVAQAEGGRCYFDQNGVLRFETATHWLQAPHTTVQYTLTEDDHQASVPDTGIDDLITGVVVELQRRVADQADELYRLDAVKECPPESQIEFEARLYRPALSISDLTPGTDYQVVSSGGMDMSGHVTLSITPRGQRALIKLTNYHASLSAYLVHLVLWGIPLAGGPQEEVIEEVASPAVPFERIRSVRGNQYIQTESQGRALARFLRDRHASLTPTWTLQGVPGIPELSLGDRIRFRDPYSTGDFREGFVIRYRWSADVAYVQDITVLDAEGLYPYSDYFVVGQTALGNGRAWY